MEIDLVNYIYSFIKNFNKSKNIRTDGIKKNIVGLLFTKVGNIVVNILMVPLLINFLTPTKYGIWLALSSVIMWFSFFDIGFGNGLRNKFAEVKAKGKIEEGKKYVSTTYAVLTIIFSFVWVCFFIINHFVDWTKILNTPPELKSELSLLALIVFSFLSMQMVLKTVNTVLIADQKPAKASALNMVGQFLVLMLVFTVGKYLNGSLFWFGLILSSVPVIILVFASFYFYAGELKKYRPSFAAINVSYTKQILILGLKFFVIQVAAIVIYQTNNIIIAQVSGPKDVAVYNVALKYFMVGSMIFNTIITPFWSSFTDAYSAYDYVWMNKMYAKLKVISLFFFLLIIFMLFVSSIVYKVWLGNSLQIDFSISIVISIYIITNIWNSLHSYILNGVGKIKLQLLFSIIGILFYIPSAMYLGKIYGIIGVVGISITLNLISAIYAPIQVKKILTKQAIGIWNA